MQKAQPQRQRGNHDVFVQRVRAITLRAQAIERGHIKRSRKITIAAATGERHFAQIEAGHTRHALRALEQRLRGQGANTALHMDAQRADGEKAGRDGGAERAAEDIGVEFLGEIPMEPSIRAGGDSGVPVVVSHPDSVQAKAFFEIAEKVAARCSVLSFAHT